MAKEKKVSVGFIDRMTNNACEFVDVEYLDSNNEVMLKVKMPTLEEAKKIVNDTVAACFDENGRYSPVMRSFAFKKAVMSALTNITVSTDDEKVWSAVMYTQLFDRVVSQLGAAADFLYDCVEEAVQYELKVNTEFVYARLNEAIGDLEGAMTSMDELFNDVTNGDLKGMIGSLSDGVFDEDKLIKSLVNVDGASR